MRMLLRSVLLLGLWLALAGCHVGRFVIYNFADVRDYKKFPAHPIAPAEQPFRFAEAHDSIQQRMAEVSLTANGKSYTLAEYVGELGRSASFLIIRNDTLLYEAYFGRYAADDPPIPSFSVAKSYVSALVGIALDEGLIKSLDDPITDYLPYLKDANPELEQITLRHLLDMRSGLKFNENSYYNPFAPIAKLYYGRRIRKYTTEIALEEPPGQSREYQSINTQLLGMVLEKVTGQSLAAYLEAKIWQPIGMEYPASWSYDSRKGQVTKAFCCINAQSRDMAKFGRLFLHQGNWQGQQIIPQAWVAASITPDYANDCYQRQWYSYRFGGIAQDSAKAASQIPPGGSVSKTASGYQYFGCGPDFMAIGILGQYIYVHPEKQLIIVRNGKDDNLSYPKLFRALALRL